MQCELSSNKSTQAVLMTLSEQNNTATLPMCRGVVLK